MANPDDHIRVLLVDDEPHARDTIAAALEDADERLHVETEAGASDGLAALEDGDSPDCIVSDYEMPDMDGIEFLRSVRALHPDLPFVLFTGEGSEAVASRAISAGVTDYLRKDVGAGQFAVLANRIATVVEGRHAAVEAERHQHRLEQILTAVPSCVVKIAADGSFEFATERATEVLGMPPAAVTERRYDDPDWEIRDLDGEPLPDEELPFRRVMDTGEPVYGARHTIRTPDGESRVLHVNGAPVFEEGELAGAVFALTDVTEQLERSQKLRETSRRLDLALEATNTGVWEWDLETDEVVWTETLEELLGIEPGAFGGTFGAHAEYVHPDDLSTVEAAAEEALTGDGDFHAEFRMIRTDGQVIWVEGRGREIEVDGSRLMVGTTTEITERKETEQALAERELLDPQIELTFEADALAALVRDEVGEEMAVELEGLVRRDSGEYLFYARVSGPTVAEFRDLIDLVPTIRSSRLLSTTGDTARYELEITSQSLAAVFDGFDGTLTGIRLEDGTCKLVGEFPETVDPEAVTSAGRERYSALELVGRRRIERPTYLRRLVEDELTSRQLTALELAHHGNYFEQPRESTGDELADRLGITRQTYNSHLRTAQATLLDLLFEGDFEPPT